MKSKIFLCFVVLLHLSFFFVGCSAVGQTISAFDSCKNDPECFAQMEQGKDLVSAIASTASASLPHTAPFSQVIGSTAGMLATLIIGVYLGNKRQKKGR